MWISIIIVSYNVRDFLANAINSLQESLAQVTPDRDGERGEIIVVDNASDDGSVDFIRSRYPSVRLLVSDHNLGFGKANNLAMKIARGKYFLIINPDTVVQEDTLRVMVEFLKAHPDVGMAGCKILNADGTIQLACRRSFPTPWVAFTKLSGLSSLFPRSRLFGRYNLTYLDPDQVHDVDALAGSFMMVRREVYEQVGGFDESFFMYGEDVDWCYRIKSAGWRIMYVPLTQIIHFKGESTKRSDIDAIGYFYDAMRVYVEKHHNRSVVGKFLLNVAIEMRLLVARFGKTARRFRFAVFDVVLIDLTIMLGELLWRGRIGSFPPFVYPFALTIPPLLFIFMMYGGRLSPTKPLSVSRAGISVILSFLIVFAFTAIFKGYAFSRAVLLLSGMMSFLIVPGWRVVLRFTGRSKNEALFGRRALIVGIGESAQEILRRLNSHPRDLYHIVGFIDVNRQRLGERINGVEILGSTETIGKVIDEHRVTDVIFSAEDISFEDILSVIGRTKSPGVNYSIVPTNREVIVGKWGVDTLDEVPLVEIEYNINLPSHRFAKRTFDIVTSLVSLLFIYPLVFLFSRNKSSSSTAGAVLQTPRVLKGEMSWVGPPEGMVPLLAQDGRTIYVGKPGVVGPVQLYTHGKLSLEDKRKLILSYAKNQSLSLDIEILVRFFTGLGE
ncbi:MAG: glycosyltransferase [Bacteroidota bacterium]